MSEARELYIWLEGDFERPPRIEAKVAPNMPLDQFRDKYVDPDKSFLIMRVYAASNDAGQSFTVTLRRASAGLAAASETIAGTTLTGIKGIGRKSTAMLRDKAGIESVEDLRAAGTTPAGRAAVARETGRSETVILRWVQLADLMRIEGVGGDFSALLWEAGIKRPADLTAQNSGRLLQLLTRINEEKHLTPHLPSLGQINDWIKQAKGLPVLVEEG
jgi:predicted flap endonuclease-1-like 5' DNA nuclease